MDCNPSSITYRKRFFDMNLLISVYLSFTSRLCFLTFLSENSTVVISIDTRFISFFPSYIYTRFHVKYCPLFSSTLSAILSILFYRSCLKKNICILYSKVYFFKSIRGIFWCLMHSHVFFDVNDTEKMYEDLQRKNVALLILASGVFNMNFSCKLSR